MLSDLRDSGTIEQDADVVMFIYRDEVYNTPEPGNSGIAEIIVSKNRSGPTGTVKLAWHVTSATFSNMGTPARKSVASSLMGGTPRRRRVQMTRPARTSPARDVRRRGEGVP